MGDRAFGLLCQSGSRAVGDGIMDTIFNGAIGAVLLLLAFTAIRRITRCA